MFFLELPQSDLGCLRSYGNIPVSSSNVKLCTEKLAPRAVKCLKLSENYGKEN